MGNICRSPMAERLLTVAVAEAAKVELEDAEELVHSHSAGTGGWHAGEEMHPSAARQVRARGGDPTGFNARRLRSDHLDAADLVLAATADQQLYVTALRPDAAARTFVLGELGRLLRLVDLAALPAAAMPAASLASHDRSDATPTPESVHTRGVALVAALGAARGGSAPLPSDDLDDPWGRGEKTFARVADEIDGVVRPLAAALFPAGLAAARH
jgi:protein-tyrosine phosphatase